MLSIFKNVLSNPDPSSAEFNIIGEIRIVKSDPNLILLSEFSLIVPRLINSPPWSIKPSIIEFNLFF